MVAWDRLASAACVLAYAFLLAYKLAHAEGSWPAYLLLLAAALIGLVLAWWPGGDE